MEATTRDQVVRLASLYDEEDRYIATVEKAKREYDRVRRDYDVVRGKIDVAELALEGRMEAGGDR
jgi:hypothetical protein